MPVDLDEGADVAQQLRDVLSENAVRVIDLFREWDEDGSGYVDKREFRKAMPLLGLEVPRRDIDDLFDEWDPDGSGMLELKELTKRLRRGSSIQLEGKLQGTAGKSRDFKEGVVAFLEKRPAKFEGR